mmetsp:Transcript_5675/g.11120  ORF Transcript_5675/g.11120 Transcript_5675/m.11120 type:complete len:416 (-) Transcript_5675:83-1330(-)
MKSFPSIPVPHLKLPMIPISDRYSYGLRKSTQEEIILEMTRYESPEMRRDQLRSMISQEQREGYRCTDYMIFYASRAEETSMTTKLSMKNEFGDIASTNGNGCSKQLNISCRTSICEWMYRVIDHFSADREVVHIALSYIDRILSTNICADRRTFKLISSASLHLAIKTHFPHLWHDVGRLLPELSRGDFAMGDLLAMENELLHSLTWLLNPPTPQAITMHMLSLLPRNLSRTTLENVANICLYLIELSVADYFFVTTKKAIVAIAALLNAIENQERQPLDGNNTFASIHHDYHFHIEKMLVDMDYHANWFEITSVRDRLWDLYHQSNESTLHQRVLSPVNHAKLEDESCFLRGFPSPTSCLSPTFGGDDSQVGTRNRLRVRSDFDYAQNDRITRAQPVGLNEPINEDNITVRSF